MLPQSHLAHAHRFNANGVIYEQIVDFLDVYARQVRANVLVFNFRGVGGSTGWPYVASDLTEDGVAVTKYILSKGVSESDITYHGHSLGGAVAADTHRRFPKTKCVSDRSFSSMSTEAAVMMKTPLGTVLGAALGMLLASA